jgi:hypothetical protein
VHRRLKDPVMSDVANRTVQHGRGEGYAGIYDVDLNPKPAFYALQQDLTLAADGAARRPHTR